MSAAAEQEEDTHPIVAGVRHCGWCLDEQRKLLSASQMQIHNCPCCLCCFGRTVAPK